MRNSQEQNTFKRIMHSKAGLLLLGVFVLFFSWNVFTFAVKAKETAQNRDVAQEKIVSLQQQKDRLTKDIDSLNTQSGVEETIRDKFGLAKDGEGMIVVTDGDTTTTDQTTQVNPSLWMRIKAWFSKL